MEKDTGSFEDIARNKLAQAIDDLESADILLGADKYRAANNRAYYAVFHAIDAVLSMEPVAFKKHKDVIAYFNKNYVNKDVFSRDMGRKISKLEIIRHKSDYLGNKNVFEYGVVFEIHFLCGKKNCHRFSSGAGGNVLWKLRNVIQKKETK